MCHSPNKIDKSTINQLNEVDDSSIDYSEEYESIPTWWAQFLTLYRSCKIYCTSSKVYEKIQCSIIFSKIWKMWILFVFNLWISFLLSFFLFFSRKQFSPFYKFPISPLFDSPPHSPASLPISKKFLYTSTYAHFSEVLSIPRSHYKEGGTVL